MVKNACKTNTDDGDYVLNNPNWTTVLQKITKAMETHEWWGRRIVGTPLENDLPVRATKVILNNMTIWKTGIPPNSRPVLAVTISDVVGSLKKRRQIVRAQYIRHKEMESESWDDNEGIEWYCEEEDKYFIVQGWYELFNYHLEYGYSFIDDPVIAWCEMPELPENLEDDT